MRLTSSTLFVVSLLLLSTIPFSSASQGRSTVCSSTDLSSIPDPIIINDQSCEQIALGILQPGTIVEFEVTGDVNFDFLVFRNAALQVYANDQSYRSPTYWAEDTVFEDMVGSARWHWTVPTDESEKNWWVVLDNLAHPSDDGEGAQGGTSVQINLDISFPTPNYWNLYDGLVQLPVNDHSKLIDENSLILDEGTQVEISAIPMDGNPDLFILTESQRAGYLDGSAPEFRVNGADLLDITTEGSVTWTVDSEHANQPLYIYADNEQGPTGGGDGQSNAKFTVIINLLPVLNATISSDSPSYTIGDFIDVGETITLSANSTPNLSSQIDTTQFQWDLDGDGQFEFTGSWAEVDWPTEGSNTIHLRVNGVDGRTDTSSITIDVDDVTDPVAIINGGSTIVRGFGESFTLTSSSTDNFGIDREEWWADGILVQNNSGTGNTFTYSFESDGNHSVELKSFDLANRNSTVTASILIQDRTAPILDDISGPIEVKQGEENSWRLNATDDESPTLYWVWDFDLETDSDGDGDSTNDIQAAGDLVSWTFNKGGDYSITCTVTNEQGISSSREVNVYVESEPKSSSSSMEMIYTIGGVLGALVIVAGIVGAILSVRRRRAHQSMMRIEAERAALEEAEAAREPTHEEQLSMYQSRNENTGFQRAGSGDEMAEIAGVGSSYGGQRPATSAPVQNVSDDALLAAFVEEDEPQPEEISKPEPTPTSKPVESSGPQGSVIASGIQLPDVITRTSSPSETKPEPVAQVQPQTTEVTGVCKSCGQQYAVDMPVGVNQARVDCPKCGEPGIISR